MNSQLKEYLASSSPISKLQKQSKVPLKDIRNSVDLKMSLMKQQTKNYGSFPNKSTHKEQQNNKKKASNQQFLDMKASSIIYNIPEFSPPEINFELSDLIRHKINEIKDELVTKLPNIKSSHFSSNKIQAVFSRRTVLKDLQDWLQEKLKNPPLTHEDSIQYKNMIMGVGMKQAIRLIGTRCSEQANIVSQIWELTWSICREIILYLSKRAHKCQKILEQQAQFFRNGCQKRIRDNDETVARLYEENILLKQKCEKFSTENQRIKKNSKQLKLTKMNLEEMNAQLKEVFEAAFKENLVLQLKLFPNDQSKIGSIGKKYMNMLKSMDKNNIMFKEFLRRILNEAQFLNEIEQEGQIQLARNMNQFKIQENQRRMQIDKQLHEKLKTIQVEIQTHNVEVQNFSIETDRVEVQEINIGTDQILFSEFGVNTEGSTEISSKSKSKNQRNSKLTNIVHQKKKTSISSKLKSKISINIQIGKQPLTEQFVITQQLVKSQNLAPITKINEQLIESDHQILISASQNISAIKEISQLGEASANSQQKQEKKELPEKVSQQQTSKLIEKVESSSESFQKKLKILNSQEVNIEQNQSLFLSQRPFINQCLVEKQIQVDLLKEELLNAQKSHRKEFLKMNVELSNQNNMINNLKRELKTLHKQNEVKLEIKDVVQQVKEELQKSHHSPKQNILSSNSHLQQLLREQKYQLLIQQLLLLTSNIYHNQLEQPSLTHQINQSVQNELQQKRPKISLEYQKKTFVPIKTLVERPSSNIQLSQFSDEEEVLENLAQTQIISTSSKRISRRESSKSILVLKSLKRKIREGKSKSISLIPQTFLEIVTKYFFTNSQNWSQTSSAVRPVGNMTQNNKKLTREQYTQIYKQVNESPQAIKNQKQMRTIIDKALNTILKELCKEVIISVQKQGIDKVWELKMNYSPLYILMTNRFNMNYGVRKVSSKHVKDLIISLKGIKKYTQKYAVISYFMLNSTSVTSGDLNQQHRDSELLFFYILLITLVEGMSANRSIEKSELIPIIDLGMKFLTRDPKFISKISSIPSQLELQSIGNNTFHNFYKKLISAYKDVWIERENEMRFIFECLSKPLKEQKCFIKWQDFVDFVSVFNICSQAKLSNQQNGWHYYVITTMMQTIIQEKPTDPSIITFQIYLKFVVKCPQFNLKVMQDHLSFIQTDSDLSDPDIQNKILSLCSPYDLLIHIAKHLFESQSLIENEENFWVKYLRCYVIEKEVQELVGSLAHGILDKRTKQIILAKQFGKN